MARAVTAKDVAKAAGVSQATVSYVINDHPDQKISAATRARVLDAVADLGYTPSSAARALRKGSSDLVLLLLPDIPFGPVVAHLMEQLTDELEPFGLMAVTRRIRAGTPVSSLWRELRPAAMVTIAPLSEQDEREIHAAGIPVIGTALAPVSGVDMSSGPQTAIGYMQVEHLAFMGHRRLGYAAPDDVRVARFFGPRLAGARAACLALGLDQPVVLEVPLDAGSAALAVDAWRQGLDPVTAVCAYNDDTAFALLAGMHRRGLSAPGDLAVIGVDNIPLAALASPPLTTVDQNLDPVAAQIAREITAALQGAPPPDTDAAEVITLVVRASA
ncbi:MAG: LacI family transcriptional regulator [Cellulomonadaceae bacterium]|nr:LacI family transcriptional regulator [Cellulomonadaceae bacterium]